MTLIAGLSVGGLPAFIGDLLVSWRVPSAVDLPTQWQEGVHPGLGEYNAAGLAQKLVIVRSYLLVAWAGERAEANRIIHELDTELPANKSELRDPNAIFRILATCSENLELITLLRWNGGIHPICVRTRGFELDSRRVYLLGSGASEFFEYLRNDPDILPNQEQADGLLTRAIMLRFAARSAALQLTMGIGLQDSWGGGFEVVYPDHGTFRKVDNFMFRAWMMDEKGTYHNSGRSFFLRYYGADLHLSWFNPGERTYIIRSPLRKPCDIPTFEEVHPEWMVDLFIVKETGAFFEFARFHPLERPLADKIQLTNGLLAGWALDRNYVEQCIQKVFSSSGKNNHFEMMRY